MYTNLMNHKRVWGTLLIILIVTSTLLIMYYAYQLMFQPGPASVPAPALAFSELFPGDPIDQPVEDIPCVPEMKQLIRPPVIKRMGGLSNESFGYGYRPTRIQSVHPLYLFPVPWQTLQGERIIQCSILGVSENGYLYQYVGGKIENLIVVYSPEHTPSQKLVWFHYVGFQSFKRVVDAGYRASLSGELAIAYENVFDLKGSPIPLPVP